jgi:autotransporter-associated beta strand protein
MKSLTLVPAALLAVLPTVPAQSTWNGATAGWNTSSNWSPASVPAANSDLVFGNNGELSMNNTIAQGRIFRSLTFSRAGYQVTQNGIGLHHPSGVALRTTHTGGTTGIGITITLQTAAQTFEAQNGSTLEFLVNSGGINLNGRNLTLATPLPDSRIINRTAISGTGNITKTGTGTWVLDNAHSYTGTTTIQEGALEVMSFGQLNSFGNVVVSSGARLTGSGIISILGNTLQIAGSIQPGNADDPLARLRVQGDLTATGPAAEMVFDIKNTGSPGAFFDQIQVIVGNVSLGGAAMTLVPTQRQAYGAQFTLIEKGAAGPITGTFSSLPEGATRNFGLNGYRFSYIGGDGNDFTATVGAAAPTGNLRTWDAGGATTTWSDAANWDGDTLPVAGDILRFSSDAFQNTNNDRGGAYHRLEFTGEGLHSLTASGLGANPLTLTDGVVSSQPSGGATINNTLDIGANQTFATSAGNLVFHLNSQIRLHGHTLTLAANQANAGIITINSQLTGPGNLIKTGPGIARITGSASIPNDFTGSTTVLEGELHLNRPTSGVNAIPGDISVGGGAGPAVLSTSVADKIIDTATLAVAANGSFLPGAAETVANLAMTGGSVATGTSVLSLTQGVSKTGSAAATISGRLRLAGSGQRTLQVAGTGALVIDAETDRAADAEWLKTGTGTAVIDGAAAVGAIEVAAGTLRVNGDTTSTEIRPLPGSLVTGSGVLGLLNIKGGVIVPGNGSGSSQLVCAGPMATDNNPHVFRAIVDGSSSSPLVCMGTVQIDNGELEIREITVPPVDAKLVILKNDGPGPVSGQFLQNGVPVPEDGVVVGLGGRYRITYAGGASGRDVEIISRPITATGVTRTWSGGGGLGSRLWSNPANWSGGTLPQPGDAVLFPAANVFLSTIQDLPAGLTLASLTITGASPDTLDFNGNAITLINGFSCSMNDTAGRFINLNLPITLSGSAAEIAVTGIRPVNVNAALAHLGSTLTLRGNGVDAPALFGGLIVNTAVSGTFATLIEDLGGLRLTSGAPQAFNGPVTVESGRLSTLGPAQINGDLTVGGDPTRAAVAALTVNALGGYPDIVVLPNGTLTGPSNPVDEMRIEGGNATLTGTWQIRSRVEVSSGSLDASAATLNFPLTTPPGPLPRRIDLGPATPVTVLRLNSASNVPLVIGGGTLRVTEQMSAFPLIASGGATVECDATEAPYSAVTLEGGTLAGTGRVATVTAIPTFSGNRIAPGNGSDPYGTLAIGGLVAPAGTQPLDLAFRLSGIAPSSSNSRLILLSGSPAPALDGCTVTHTLPGIMSSIQTPGTAFLLFDNQTATPFPTLPPTRPEGHLAAVLASLLRTSYFGGDGNDLTLTVFANQPLPQPKLDAFTIQTPGALGPGSPATLSGSITGGPPNTAVFVEASSDLGITDPWRQLRVIILDSNGAASIPATPDPQLGPKGFFRVKLP